MAWFLAIRQGSDSCHPMKASFPLLPSTEKVFIFWQHLDWRKILKEEKIIGKWIIKKSKEKSCNCDLKIYLLSEKSSSHSGVHRGPQATPIQAAVIRPTYQERRAPLKMQIYPSIHPLLKVEGSAHTTSPTKACIVNCGGSSTEWAVTGREGAWQRLSKLTYSLTSHFTL